MATSIIDFKATRCKHCYKCVRYCDVKAIQFQDERAMIIPDKCILCGHCLNICPQSAKELASALDVVKQMIASGIPVIASIAPSYMGMLEYNSTAQVRSALLSLGFSEVLETSEGASLVTESYKKLIDKHSLENIISSCCPSVNNLIEIYYPRLLPYLAPVVSPMVAHGRMIKARYGSDTKVVFIGPCIAKKKESLTINSCIDAVLTFDDIGRWLAESNIDIRDCAEKPFPIPGPGINRLYPVTGGILDAVTNSSSSDSYYKLSVSGSQDCIDLCESLTKKELSGAFIEMNMCDGGCIRGSAPTKHKHSIFKIKHDMTSAIKAQIKSAPTTGLGPDAAANMPAPVSIDLNKSFRDRSQRDILPTEDQLRAILRMTNKFSPADEQNCGACGYNTCREKAVAVFQNKAEVSMCIPFMHEKAESMSNLVLETSPNIIIVVDANMRILEYSVASEKYFGIKRSQALEMYLDEIIDTDDFRWVLDTHQSIHGKKVRYDQYNISTLQNIVYINKENAVMGIFIDTTREEKQSKAEYEKKLETIDIAQKIIHKQMMVVQEIAGLLGETTAEPQITLSRLCQTLLDDTECGENEKSSEDLSTAIKNPSTHPGYVHVGKISDLKPRR